MRAAILALIALLAWSHPAAAQLDRITNREAVSALKTALEKGAGRAVSSLGRTDGFFGNPQVRIPLPASLHRAERTMRRFGLGRYATPPPRRTFAAPPRTGCAPAFCRSSAGPRPG
jgi:hypothetical protein